ncbi:MAG: conjugative transfer signal peptidase TraF [Rhodothermales bacterium]
MMRKIGTLTRGGALLTVVLLALIGVILVAPPGFVTPPFFYNETPSLPKGFYYIRKTDSLEVGDLVRMCVPERWAQLARQRGYLGRGNCGGSSTPLGKMVVASPGDTVDVGLDGVRVGGRLLSGSKPHLVDSKNRPLDVALGRHILGLNECFVLSTLYDLSFDSRYFGPVACEVPHYVLYPASDSARRILDSLKVAVRRELLLR